jgi:tetratricopeptide (TPR) repeat protein
MPMRMMAVMLLLGLVHLNAAAAQDQTAVANTQTVTTDSVVVHINEPEQEEAAKNRPGVIAVDQLRLSDKAWKEVQQCTSILRTGDRPAATQHMEKAVALDPDIAVLHNVLGVLYSDLKEYDKALEQFEEALRLRPNYRLAADNVTVILSVQHRYREAEVVARRALAIQPQAASSQYLLGAILIAEGRDSEEAAALLEKVKVKYVRAWLFLAKAAEGRGADAEAAEDVRQYLRVPVAKDKSLAQGWLGNLEQGQRVQRNTDLSPVGHWRDSR